MKPLDSAANGNSHNHSAGAKFTARLVTVLVLMMAISACGNKGELYLPEPDETTQKEQSD